MTLLRRLTDRAARAARVALIASCALGAVIAHAQDHHPELLVGFNACTVSYSTHSRGGLTLNDCICAAQVGALPEATGG